MSDLDIICAALRIHGYWMIAEEIEKMAQQRDEEDELMVAEAAEAELRDSLED